MGNMMHRGKGSFTHVENTVFFDHTLSLKAKGIYCQIRSLENNPEWVFTIRGFATLVKDGLISLKFRVPVPVFLMVTVFAMELDSSCVNPASTVPKSTTAVPSSDAVSAAASAA